MEEGSRVSVPGCERKMGSRRPAGRRRYYVQTVQIGAACDLGKSGASV